MAEKRVTKVLEHLSNSNPKQEEEPRKITGEGCPFMQANQTASSAAGAPPSFAPVPEPTPEEIENHIQAMQQLGSTLEDRRPKTRLNELIPGPLDDTPESEVLAQLQKAFLAGQNMLLMEKWCKKFGNNIVTPMTITPRSQMPYKDWMGEFIF